MPIEGPRDTNPRPNQSPQGQNPEEAGYTPDEVTVPREAGRISLALTQIRQAGGEVISIVRNADKADVIRGMGNQF